MRSYGRNRLLLESPIQKPASILMEMNETRLTPQGFMQEAGNDLSHLQDQLRQQAATLQAQNKELEIYAHVVAHDLKDPLTVMIVTSDLGSDIPELTRKELKE